MATVAPTQGITLTTQATVTPEGLRLPLEVMEKLALAPGSQVSIIIHPSSPGLGRVRAEETVQRLRAMLGNGPSLEDEYFATRDKDKW